MARQDWFDEATQTPLIDDYAQKLGSFIDAMADGRIDESELKSAEERLVGLMREVEPQLDDALHEKVTQLLCEMTAFGVMQFLHEVQQARPQTTFQG